MHLPRFRLRTLMIAVVLASAGLGFLTSSRLDIRYPLGVWIVAVVWATCTITPTRPVALRLFLLLPALVLLYFGIIGCRWLADHCLFGLDRP